jgi:hypothetical protein
LTINSPNAQKHTAQGKALNYYQLSIINYQFPYKAIRSAAGTNKTNLLEKEPSGAVYIYIT